MKELLSALRAACIDEGLQADNEAEWIIRNKNEE